MWIQYETVETLRAGQIRRQFFLVVEKGSGFIEWIKKKKREPTKKKWLGNRRFPGNN